MNLRDYELDWVERIKTSRASRVLLVGPTGSGKTVVAVHLIREALERHAKVLFLAHRAELIEQAKRRLVDHGVSELDIGTIMAGEKENREARVQVASIHTLVRRELPPAALVFVDEAHHAAASTYRRILDQYRSALVFGLTATPYRLDGKPLGDLFEEIIESSKPSALIEAGWLSRPRVFTVPEEFRPDLSGVKVTGGDFNVGQLASATKSKRLVGGIVDHWKRLADGLPTVCYAVSVEHGERIRAAFRTAGVKVELLTGETEKSNRAAMLSRLASGEISIVVNCMVLTEGWDCPEARCAIIARPTMSQSLWFQMAGRIMRKGDVTPLILDHAGNALVHPLPGTDLDFSLETAQPKARKFGAAKEKTCVNCGSSSHLGQRVCQCCGFEFWSGAPPDEVLAELREIDADVAIGGIVRLYVEERLSSTEIAKRYGCSATKILTRLRAAGVKRRTLKEIKGGPPEEETPRIVRLYVDDKLSLLEISRRYACSDVCIGKVLRLSGVKIRSNIEVHGGLSEEERRRIVHLYVEERLSSTEIAKRYGCSPNAILRYLRSEGVKRRTIKEIKGGPPEEETPRIVRLYSSEMLSSKEIAKRYGCNPQTIIKRLREAGVHIRSLTEVRHNSLARLAFTESTAEAS